MVWFVLREESFLKFDAVGHFQSVKTMIIWHDRNVWWKNGLHLVVSYNLKFLLQNCDMKSKHFTPCCQAMADLSSLKSVLLGLCITGLTTHLYCKHQISKDHAEAQLKCQWNVTFTCSKQRAYLNILCRFLGLLSILHDFVILCILSQSTLLPACLSRHISVSPFVVMHVACQWPYWY